jgi:hypothetical protein
LSTPPLPEIREIVGEAAEDAVFASAIVSLAVRTGALSAVGVAGRAAGDAVASTVMAAAMAATDATAAASSLSGT